MIDIFILGNDGQLKYMFFYYAAICGFVYVYSRYYLFSGMYVNIHKCISFGAVGGIYLCILMGHYPTFII